MDGLQIGQDFALPYEAVTQTFALLAKRGVGKTYTAARMVEQMLHARLPVCVIDPIGVWWGLRASSDGQSEGLKILVLGGDHGDLPLTEDMGEAVANLLVDHRVSMVLDFAHFRKAAQVRFMTAFAETLYHRNREPLHLVVDEADAFAPQRPQKGQERMLGAMEDIVRRGRARGLGVTLITQRAAVLNKDVLTQVEVLVALRTIAPQDRDAVDAWIRVHGTAEQRAELLNSLASLPIGTAWFWSPGWLDVFRQVKVLRRETFDSSATPKVGEQLVQPQTVAAVDIETVRGLLSTSIERAEAQDIGHLQRKIADLQKQLRSKPPVQVERVEVPVLRNEQIDELRALANEMIGQAQSLLAFGQDILAVIEKASPPAMPAPRVEPKPIAQLPSALPAEPKTDEIKTLRAGAIRILKAIARRNVVPLTRMQIATLAGFAHGGGTFSTYMSDLRKAGYILEGAEGTIASVEGFNLVADELPPEPQTTEDLLAMWRESLRSGAFRMLEELVGYYPGGLTRAELGESTSFAVTGGTFSTYLSNLRRNGLIEERAGVLYASDTLFIDRVNS